MAEYNVKINYNKIADKVKDLKGSFAIGVNKCSAQFSKIYFGPNKIERTEQLIKKKISELENLEDGEMNKEKRELSESLKLLLKINAKKFAIYLKDLRIIKRNVLPASSCESPIS